MKYDFYDDMGILNNFIPNSYDSNLKNNMNNGLNQNNSMNSINNMMSPNTINDGSNRLNLYSPYEGYTNGNGFRDQYIPYKNYKPVRIDITNEKEEMLVNIGQYGFMAHEMNLYLDNYPNDREALNKFIEFRDRANELIKMYERKYGPLNISGVANNIPFSWESGSWPWVN